MLGDLLFGQTRGGVLMLLYSRLDESFYVREIARRIGVSVGIVQRELETLYQVQLVHRRKTGNQVFYQANREHPVFSELSALVAKTLGIFEMIRSALVPLEKKIRWAFVYGSPARQQERAESDVDVMIVGDVSLDEVLPLLAEVGNTSGRAVNPTVFTETEFREKGKEGNHFVGSVMRGKKITLIGDEDEFGKVA